MVLETLNKDMVAAMKAGDKTKTQVLRNLIDTVRKAAITPKGRVEITDQIANEALVKYQKTVQEMIDTCPASHQEKLIGYQIEMTIVQQYAPQLIKDENEITTIVKEKIATAGIKPVKANRGAIMKLLSAELKGKVDMKTANKVVGNIIV